MIKMATILSLGLSWVLALSALGDDASARAVDDLRGRVQALVQPLLEKKQSVGVVVGVIEAGRTHVFGFGREALGGDKAPDGKTIFEIGSVTKVFTSLALAEMAQQSLVRLDDPVQRYLPKEVNVASRAGREITLEDLNIDEFSRELYTPRKLYQVMVDRTSQLLPDVCTPHERDVRRLETIHQAMADLVAATGRFRTFQVEILRLYGYNMELLSHYLAIWRFLKHTRRCMERGASLYSPGEQSGSEDAFYNLFDVFRFRISVARFVHRAPAAAKPPESVIAEMRRLGDEVFDQYFAAARPEPDSGDPIQTIPKTEAKSESESIRCSKFFTKSNRSYPYSCGTRAPGIAS
jgi:Beta-lactamase